MNAMPFEVYYKSTKKSSLFDFSHNTVVRSIFEVFFITNMFQNQERMS